MSTGAKKAMADQENKTAEIVSPEPAQASEHGHRDRANAHLFAGPDDPAGNLSPIGDENLSEASRSVHKSEQ